MHYQCPMKMLSYFITVAVGKSNHYIGVLATMTITRGIKVCYLLDKCWDLEN